MVNFIDLKKQQEPIRKSILARLENILDHGQYVLGKELVELEKELCTFSGSKYCLGVSSGTDALVVPMMAWGIQKTDAVFVPAFTYTATAEAILVAGGTPVFVDVDPDTFNIDTAHLEEMVNKVREDGQLNPRGVLAVDLFGQPADYSHLIPYCEKNNLFLLSDAAQAFGGSLGNRKIGSVAPVTGTSFYPSKPLGCYGDGGAVFTDNEDTYTLMKSVRGHGQGKHKYDVERVGLNARLDTMQAAILLEKLTLFPDELVSREKVACRYDDALCDSVVVPKRVPGSTSAWAQYTVKAEKRTELVASLKESGVPAMIFYPTPMHFQQAYAEYGNGKGSLPVSEALCDQVVSLPMHPYLEKSDQDKVIAAISSFYRKGVAA